MADPMEKILRELDYPVEPRPEFGTRLLDQVLDSLGATTSVGVAARPRFPFLREFAAAAAVLVFVAGLAVAFSVLRSGRQPSVSPSPPVLSPSPAVTQPLSVDRARAVILFRDAGNDVVQVDGMTWDGQSGYVTRLPSANQISTSASSSNPAGTLFVAFPDIVDRSGRVVAKLTGGPYADVGDIFFGTWADDELHYCQVVPFKALGTNPEQGTLQLMTPGGRPRDVAQVGMQAPGGNALTVSVCSVLGDRALVTQRNPISGSDGNAVDRYWVVQLSSGHVLWTHDLHGRGIVFVVGSRDGRYVAEVQPTGSTTIYGADGSVVGHVDGSIRAFSWDGSLAVVGAGAGQASVIRWKDKTVIWTVPPGQSLSGYQAEPGGTSLAIMTMDTTHPSTGLSPPLGVLYAVSSDGRVLGQHEVRSGSLLACTPLACAP